MILHITLFQTTKYVKMSPFSYLNANCPHYDPFALFKYIGLVYVHFYLSV